jgi:hypothetical protein
LLRKEFKDDPQSWKVAHMGWNLKYTFTNFYSEVVKEHREFLELEDCRIFYTSDPDSFSKRVWEEAIDDIFCTIKDLDPFAKRFTS